jgi:hypothetical protein
MEDFRECNFIHVVQYKSKISLYFTSLGDPFPKNNTSSINDKWDRDKDLPNLMHFMMPLLWYEFNALLSLLSTTKKRRGDKG